MKGIHRVLCLLLLSFIAIPSVLTYAVNVWFLGVDNSNPSIGIAMKSRIQIRQSPSYRVSIHNVEFDKNVVYSFLLAGYAMKYVCGVNIDGIAIDVYIDGRRQVRGSSASLAYTMAILKALNKTNITAFSWGATGVTSIDGFIDAVGGLYAKIEAAKESGLEIVYIPTINALIYSANSEAPRIVRVTSLADLCRDLDFNRVPMKLPPEGFEMVNKFFMYRAIEFLNMSKALIDKFPIDMRRTVFLEYKNLSTNVEKVLERGHGYTAASYAFTGYMQILHRYLMLNNSISNYLVDESKNIIESALNRFNNFRYIHPSTIPILVVILDRITEAQFYADLYKNLTQSSIPSRSPTIVLEAVTRAYTRSLTIDTWLDLLEMVNSTMVTNRDCPLIEFNRVYDATLSVLKAVSLTIEWNQEFAPLSLSAIASVRSTLAKQLDEESRLRVANELRKLYIIHTSYLDDDAKIVPYIYYIYAKDLELDGSSDYISILSMSTLIASITNIINSILSRGGLPIQPEYTEVPLLYNARVVALFLNIIVAFLLLVLLLHIIEKSLGSTPSYTIFNRI
ncbi:MAG: hypothetical protein QW438_02620 [Ignisphaera sp.]